MKFKSRADAGEALANRLVKVEGHGGPVLVLGIPRGGVILAEIVSRRLGAGFDIVIPRKLGAPGNEELAIGAVMEDGTEYVNRYLVTALRIQPEYLADEKAKQMAEIRRRSAAYRRPGMPYRIEGKTVVLVDDGVATGATVIAAARWVKKQKPDTLVIAVPVAPAQTVEALRHEADAVIVLETPRDFGAVGEFYEEFKPVTDDQVMDIMRKNDLL
ncbi:MAG: phosphoribosyltransferase family protein [Nitrososphaera sp.]|uniref:phosphoribosyltransferase n=1 Tax=Nitrososphaera sp. TaxID=1971748 RepID=UPI0017F2A3D0|nr:phosphoribosyltransferase family protein [Nitrososphaera sp.]NWG36994.1 phosphoribosyltransferase [Nitrososphaera sp.]